jgi:phosphoglucomutase
MSSPNPLAGKPAPEHLLVNVARLMTAYYGIKPDVSVATQRVTFGTSGHRGSAFLGSFNEDHVLAISQAIAEYRAAAGILGPLFLGIDTHALSESASASAIEVLAANGVTLMLAKDGGYTPTPAVSRAIVAHNATHPTALADGIVVTPSHNPPEDGGFKYNATHGGPAEGAITEKIQARANQLLAASLDGVKRWTLTRALAAPTTHQHDFMGEYVAALPSVIDIALIQNAKLRLGVDPLGGASVAYWPRIAEQFGLDLEVVNRSVDATFRFMTLDWDGRIRMDPSSAFAMTGLVAIRDRFDLAFACDTDADRHGIVTKSNGLMPPNHVLSVLANELFSNRPEWPEAAHLGKTVVSSQMIDAVAKGVLRNVMEVPVGFKWFVDGLSTGNVAIAGEESAGAAFLKRDGTTWTTDKDGLIACLACAEMTARRGRDPAELYHELEDRYGALAFSRADAAATLEQKERLAKLAPSAVTAKTLLGSPIVSVIDRAPGNNAPIGGLKVISKAHWFAVRPSGTEDIYKIYAESSEGESVLPALFTEAQQIVDHALAN